MRKTESMTSHIISQQSGKQQAKETKVQTHDVNESICLPLCDKVCPIALGYSITDEGKSRDRDRGSQPARIQQL